MILCFIYILISVTPLPLQADENQLPSFRSSVVTDGKPILRGGGPEPEEEEAPDNDVSEEVASSSAEDSETSNIVDDLAVFVKWLMENYGYNIHQETRRSDHTEDTTTDASPGIQLRSHHKKRKLRNKHRKRKRKHHTKKIHLLRGNSVEKNISSKTSNVEETESRNIITEKRTNTSSNILRNHILNGDYSSWDGENSNAENNDFKNVFGENINTKTLNDDNYKDDYKPTTLNLLDIVNVIRNKLPGFGTNVREPSSSEEQEEEPISEMLRMPPDDINPAKKRNFTLALSLQI